MPTPRRRPQSVGVERERMAKLKKGQEGNSGDNSKKNEQASNTPKREDEENPLPPPHHHQQHQQHQEALEEEEDKDTTSLSTPLSLLSHSEVMTWVQALKFPVDEFERRKMTGRELRCLSPTELEQQFGFTAPQIQKYSEHLEKLTLFCEERMQEGSRNRSKVNMASRVGTPNAKAFPSLSSGINNNNNNNNSNNNHSNNRHGGIPIITVKKPAYGNAPGSSHRGVIRSYSAEAQNNERMLSEMEAASMIEWTSGNVPHIQIPLPDMDPFSIPDFPHLQVPENLTSMFRRPIPSNLCLTSDNFAFMPLELLQGTLHDDLEEVIQQQGIEKKKGAKKPTTPTSPPALAQTNTSNKKKLVALSGMDDISARLIMLIGSDGSGKSRALIHTSSKLDSSHFLLLLDCALWRDVLQRAAERDSLEEQDKSTKAFESQSHLISAFLQLITSHLCCLRSFFRKFEINDCTSKEGFFWNGSSAARCWLLYQLSPSGHAELSTVFRAMRPLNPIEMKDLRAACLREISQLRPEAKLILGIDHAHLLLAGHPELDESFEGDNESDTDGAADSPNPRGSLVFPLFASLSAAVCEREKICSHCIVVTNSLKLIPPIGTEKVACFAFGVSLKPLHVESLLREFLRVEDINITQLAFALQGRPKFAIRFLQCVAWSALNPGRSGDKPEVLKRAYSDCKRELGAVIKAAIEHLPSRDEKSINNETTEDEDEDESELSRSKLELLQNLLRYGWVVVRRGSGYDKLMQLGIVPSLSSITDECVTFASTEHLMFSLIRSILTRKLQRQSKHAEKNTTESTTKQSSSSSSTTTSVKSPPAATAVTLKSTASLPLYVWSWVSPVVTFPFVAFSAAWKIVVGDEDDEDIEYEQDDDESNENDNTTKK